MKSRTIPSQPSGRSAATPPIRNQFGCMRAPHIASPVRRADSHAGDTKPVWMHARPANGFDDAKRALPVVERVEHRRKLPQVLRERAVPDQMTDDPKQFG